LREETLQALKAGFNCCCP